MLAPPAPLLAATFGLSGLPAAPPHDIAALPPLSGPPPAFPSLASDAPAEHAPLAVDGILTGVPLPPQLVQSILAGGPTVIFGEPPVMGDPPRPRARAFELVRSMPAPYAVLMFGIGAVLLLASAGLAYRGRQGVPYSESGDTVCVSGCPPLPRLVLSQPQRLTGRS